MTQKLTEEQQRAAHKIIKANRGDCGSIFLPNISCIDCPNSSHNSGVLCFVSNFPESSKSPAFQAENLRRSQAWLDEHITDAEIMAESPREFCERMVRTKGNGKCFATIKGNNSLCKNCVISINGNGCCTPDCLERANAYLASHSATAQEPPKRRPTPEEMVVGATVRVRLWDELVRDGKLNYHGHIKFPTIYFNNEMRQYCGNTYKIIVGGHSCHLDGCGDWSFIPEMLDCVEPEKLVEPVANTPTPEALRIIALEGQVDDLTKKLAASKKLCERQQRRLRAKWEAKRDGEMATEEEIVKWWKSDLGDAIKDWKIRPKGRTDWIPATRGNLKL